MTKKKTKKTTKAQKTKTKATAKKARSSRADSDERRVELAYDAPDANVVAVTGTFCGWDERIRMKQDASGRWRTTLTLPAGDYEYRFLVDGEWRDDPNCSERVPNRYGSENCVLHV